MTSVSNLYGIARAKRLHDNKWCEGYIVWDIGGEPHIIDPKTVEMDGHHVSIDSDIPAFFIPETVGYYTGKDVKQHNGDVKKLFTGDIIFARYSRLLVDFDKEFYAFWTYYINDRGERCRLCPLCEIAPWELGSIVGNVYDNPGLLKEHK